MLLQRGFTLIELIVAIFVFAVLSVVTYGSLNNVITVSALTASRAEQVGDLQRTVGVIERDFLQLAPRAITSELGQSRAAVVIEAFPIPLIEFTRAGVANPMQAAKSSLQRVSYSLVNDRLVRTTWNVLDRATQTQPAHEEVLLEGVLQFRIRGFIDNSWMDAWPSNSYSGSITTPEEILSQTPRAIEMELETETSGKIHRFFAGAGG